MKSNILGTALFIIPIVLSASISYAGDKVVLRWYSWDTGASVYSAPISHSKALEIFRYYRDNPEAQRQGRLTVPDIFKKGTPEYEKAVISRAQ